MRPNRGAPGSATSVRREASAMTRLLDAISNFDDEAAALASFR